MPPDAPLKTTLHEWHRAHGGRLVEFGGWSMPVLYTNITDEHRAVRQRVGLFDIGHMGRLRFEGPDMVAWVERATTNHVAKLAEGQIHYSLMVDDAGGALDDILVYRPPGGGLGVVCNASNRAVVLQRLEELRSGLDAQVNDETPNTAMIAVQGPLALSTLQQVVDGPLAALKYYHIAMGKTKDGLGVAVTRTGYTGEDGFELILRADRAVQVWEALMAAGAEHGISPCGLGARDTLRFEAAMPLYGHELSQEINPYAAGLGWAIKLKKGEFAGREALERFKLNPGQARIGLALQGKRIARQGAIVRKDGRDVGLVTSGTFSPTLDASLAMALVDPEAAGVGARLAVDVRGVEEPAEVVPLPFYKRAGGGKPSA